AWEGACDGAGRGVLLAGEPVVGKTRTAAELAAEAQAAGALVLHGWCEEGVGAAYQPFTQALDQHTWNVRRPALGRQPGELRRLLPELADRVPALPQPLTSDPRAEEYVLVDAVSSWLLDASRANGLVLVLDDLHWADRPTLLMLGHLLRAATADPQARLLVLGTYRDSDVDRHHPLADLIGEVSRLHGVERIPMRGLSVGEVLALAEATAGHGLGETGISLAETLHVQTEGNPFFVEELLAHLRETGALRSQEGRWLLSDAARGAIPVGVRDVVGRRLSRLSADAGRALTHAAVVGRDFDLPLLATLLDTDEDTLVDVLDEAVTARLIEEVGADRFRFRHALVQETLYEEASATRRRRLHRRVAEAVEALRPDDVIALAHHFELGGPDDGRMSRAVEYGLAAAWQAYRTRALADAELRFRRVLEMLEEDPDDPIALDAMIGLGECQRDLGDQGYRETLLAAADRATGAPDKLVAAVLANRRSITSIVGEVDNRRVELAESALAVVGEHDSADRARLLGYLAAETVFTRDQASRLALVDEAEAIARRLGDRRLLGEVLVRTAFPAIAFDRLAAITARGAEAIALADELGDLTLRVEARGMHAWALLTAGDIAGAHEVSLEAAAIADEGTPPTLRWMTQYWLVAHEGIAARFADARTMNDELLQFGEVHGEPDRLNWWAAASTAVLLLTAEIGAMAEVIGAYADQYPALPTWRAAHVQALAQAGRISDARTVLDAHPMSLQRMVEDPYGLVGIASLAQTAWLLDARDLAESVAAAAQPYDGQWAHLFIGVVGPVSWSIGLCDVVAGRVDDGIARLEREVAAAEEKGCTAVAARIRADLVGALRRRGHDGDASAAAL
ncbi:MAG TPA: AAA family ATPase, partial [Gaiellaceae bacterium]|nr:AAA family ATPase [Gaiellaceae bacterium]